MATPKNYSLDNVSFSFNGALITQGLLSVEIAQEGDAFMYEIGSGGEVARIRKVDFRATVTVTLMGTSPDNAILSAFHEADKRTPNGTGVGVLYFQQGNDVAIAEKAWIQKAPDRKYEAESIGECAWVFACADLRRTDNGN